jgi:hypothetical protein
MAFWRWAGLGPGTVHRGARHDSWVCSSRHVWELAYLRVHYCTCVLAFTNFNKQLLVEWCTSRSRIFLASVETRHWVTSDLASGRCGRSEVAGANRSPQSVKAAGDRPCRSRTGRDAAAQRLQINECWCGKNDPCAIIFGLSCRRKVARSGVDPGSVLVIWTCRRACGFCFGCVSAAGAGGSIHRSPSGVPVFLCPTNHCSVEVSWTTRREKMLGRRHHLELVFSGSVRSGDGEKRSSKRLFNPLTGLSKNSFSGSLNRNGFEVPFNF